MSRNKADPMNRQVTGKEIGAVVFALAWIGISMFVASRNLIVGGLMLAGMFLVSFVAFQRDMRSRPPEKQAEFARSVEKFESSTFVRAMKILKLLLLLYVIYLACSIIFGANAALPYAT